jgi:hypothetical protein
MDSKNLDSGETTDLRRYQQAADVAYRYAKQKYSDKTKEKDTADKEEPFDAVSENK